MIYSIPVNNLSKLEKIIKRYNNKGANITFNVGKDLIEKGTLHYEDARTHTSTSYPIDVKCKEVFVDGKYKVNGWQFLGTIEFTSNGNIIRLADSSFENKVPTKYLHTAKICEHCGKVRNRKDTYLIYNEDTNEFKQVGSTCLLEFTQGLDADVCASMMSCLDKFVELSDKNISADEFFFNDSYSGYGVNSEKIKKYAIALVKKYGYRRMQNNSGSAVDLSNFYFQTGLPKELWQQLYGDLELASDEEVKAIDDFAQQHVEEDNFGYMRNASLAWLNDTWESRDFGLVTSFVNTYLKNVAKEEQRQKDLANKSNEYVGNVGDRITFKVSFARVLYVKDNSLYSYYAAASYTMEIVDTEGHTYVWSASTNNINAGDTITATVKAHKEYKDVKQTVITRGKVTH